MTPPGIVHPDDQQKIVDYLNTGGALYIEGVDIGYSHQGTEMFSMFDAAFLENGGQNEVDILNGQTATITENLVYTYNANDTNPHYSVDHLAADGGEVLFHSNDGIDAVIAANNRGYRTIISSVILGCFTDAAGNNTREFLMQQYLSFLDVDYTSDGEVCGYVLNENNQEPIEGAAVTLGDYQTTTDAAGYFSIIVEEGIYSLTCQHDDYYEFTYAEAVIVIPCETFTASIQMEPLVQNGAELPLITKLNGNYPNPFNPETKISFSTTESTENTENTEIVIYNLKGQKVKVLVNEKLSAGQHSAVWNGKDDSGKSVSSGVYFYKMKSGDYAETRKMILLR